MLQNEKTDKFFRKESQAWWCRLLSFEKLESHCPVPESSWKEIIKSLLCKLSLCHMLLLLYWSLFYFIVGWVCTDAALCYLSLCDFSSFIWWIFDVSFCLSSLVSYYCCAPQRDVCMVITPLGTCQKKWKWEGCEKWHAGFSLTSPSHKNVLSKWPWIVAEVSKATLLQKWDIQMRLHLCMHIYMWPLWVGRYSWQISGLKKLVNSKNNMFGWLKQ